MHPKAFDATTENNVGPLGDTVTMGVVKFPGFQVYEMPPLAVIVMGAPAQVTDELLAMDTVGIGIVEILSVEVPAQVPLEAVTVNIVAMVGETTKEPVWLVRPNGLMVKLLAAAAIFIVADDPEQTIVGDAIVTTCNGVTDMLTAAVDVPHPFCPLTIYVVLVCGAMVPPLAVPVFQVYVFAPLACKAITIPKQIFVEMVFTESTGELVFTLTAMVEATIQFDGLIAVNVYTVLTVGLTVMEGVVAPLLQL